MTAEVVDDFCYGIADTLQPIIVKQATLGISLCEPQALQEDFIVVGCKRLFLQKRPCVFRCLDGISRQCRAHTRKGTPCQRDPLPGRDYCPSHKHLEETYDGPEIPIEALQGDLPGGQEVRAAA